MDINNFEPIFRGTSFSQELILNMWDDLNAGQRIDLLLTTKAQSIGLSATMAKKAARDSNPVIRMLGIKLGNISEDDDPALYSQLSNDPSPLVRGAIKANRFFLNESDLLPLSHAERLVVIALEGHFVAPEALANFIMEGLATQTVSDEEAAYLVMEFVRNPRQIQSIQRAAFDGLDSYSMSKSFEAIWNLTTCTPWIVHRFIADEYPLWMGGDNLFTRETFPEEMLKRMSTNALEMIAFRQYEPLLKILKEEPETFPDGVHENARMGTEQEERRKQYQEDHLSDVDSLKREFREFREEVDRHFEDLLQKLSEALSKRPGFFR